MKHLNEKAQQIAKKIGVWGIVLVLIAAIGIPTTVFAVAAANKSPSQEQKEYDERDEEVDAQQAATVKITQGKAAEIAAAANDGSTLIAVELEKDGGKLVYAVDLKTSEGNAIEVTVDAMSGDILGTDANPEGDNQDENDENDAEEADEADEANDDVALAGKAKLTVDQAKEIVLVANPGATIMKTELGDENGTIIYEVKIQTKGSKKVEVKVDANNGSILPEDNENEDNDGEND